LSKACPDCDDFNVNLSKMVSSSRDLRSFAVDCVDV
jgi:hypothetical protein